MEPTVPSDPTPLSAAANALNQVRNGARIILNPRKADIGAQKVPSPPSTPKPGGIGNIFKAKETKSKAVMKVIDVERGQPGKRRLDLKCRVRITIEDGPVENLRMHVISIPMGANIPMTQSINCIYDDSNKRDANTILLEAPRTMRVYLTADGIPPSTTITIPMSADAEPKEYGNTLPMYLIDKEIRGKRDDEMTKVQKLGELAHEYGAAVTASNAYKLIKLAVEKTVGLGLPEGPDLPADRFSTPDTALLNSLGLSGFTGGILTDVTKSLPEVLPGVGVFVAAAKGTISLGTGIQAGVRSYRLRTAGDKVEDYSITQPVRPTTAISVFERMAKYQKERAKLKALGAARNFLEFGLRAAPIPFTSVVAPGLVAGDFIAKAVYNYILFREAEVANVRLQLAREQSEVAFHYALLKDGPPYVSAFIALEYDIKSLTGTWILQRDDQNIVTDLHKRGAYLKRRATEVLSEVSFAVAIVDQEHVLDVDTPET
jgi:hypothetical protein